MKKYLLLISIFIFFIMPVECFSVSAADTATIQADTVTAVPGNMVDVAVNIRNNPGIIAICIDVTYDENYLELVGVDDCKLFSGASFTPSGDCKLIPFKIMWENAIAVSDYTDTGELAILHFKVLDTAVIGTTEIRISIEEKNTFNVDLNNVHFESINGQVNIKNTTDKTHFSNVDDSQKENNVTESSDITSVTQINVDSEKIKYLMPIDEICKKVSEDFENKTGETPEDTEVIFQEGGKVSIILKNRIGSIIDTYTIDAETGKGINSNGDEVILSSENDNQKSYLIFGITAAVLILFIFLLFCKLFKSKNGNASGGI